ncbi:hypothetical protein [Rhodohalobacter sp. 8-1]|uniref:hypothetical protein n=1 Tax=Rhodohalobacter sp. 8-1 TaxID=3131972 RepID=UPI0030ED353D
MKTINTIFASLLLLCAFHTASIAQSTNVTETFKKHFNETVENVHDAENADEKRAILNDSFNKMIKALDKIESRASLTEEERAGLNTYRLGLTEKLSELNGLDGFNDINDEDLDDFSNFSQDFVEQADRTVTIGVTTALLILIILLLL